MAYSTPQAAFAALIPAFEATPAGKGVTFSQSYGASGDQSRAVLAGLPADVVDLSLEPDVTKLVAAGLVPAAWNANPTHGFVTDSVAVFLVRKGNPKHIQTWDDLVKPGVQVLTPNPFSSGSARWNVMAAYGSKLAEGATPAQAAGLPDDALPPRGQPGHLGPQRDADLPGREGRRPDRLRERGDRRPEEGVAGRLRRAPGHDPDPEPDRRPDQGERGGPVVRHLPPLAGRPGDLGGQGLPPGRRRARRARARFPTPAGLFTIDKLGGWSKVTKQFFDPTSGVVTKIEQSLGVSTAK